MSRSNAPVGTVRTQRNRKVSCEADAGCAFAVYVSRKQLVRAGVWSCPCCGEGRMLPVDFDDAQLVMAPSEVESHPWFVEYRRQLDSIAHGHAAHVQRGRVVRQPEQLAVERLERERRDRARRNRLDALRRGQAADAREHSDSIPF